MFPALSQYSKTFDQPLICPLMSANVRLIKDSNACRLRGRGSAVQLALAL
jgi:hypothetical protein